MPTIDLLAMLLALRSMGIVVMAKADHMSRPALPIPSNRRVSAFTDQKVVDRWAEEAAGIRALASDDNDITMFGTIGEDYWSGEGITAKKVASQLKAIGDRPVEVQINSPGGDVFEGIAIYNVLREHPQPITVKVLGMAASAASIIAMAADDLRIGAASFLMIHNCWVMAIGNRHDLKEASEFLEPFDNALANVYAARTGLDVKQIAKWMDAETYMSGAQAIERGFADGLLPSDEISVDEKAKVSDKETNGIRAVEHALVAAGHSRTQARARISALRGKPDAAPEGVSTKQDAGGLNLESLNALVRSMKEGV